MWSEAERSEKRARVRSAADASQGGALVHAIRELLQGSAKRITDTHFCASALERLGSNATSQAGLQRLRTFVVRSVTLEPLLSTLKVQAALQGFVLDLRLGDFGSYLDEPVNPEGALARFDPELVFLVLDLDDVAGNLHQVVAEGDSAAVEDALQDILGLLEQLLRGLRRFSRARLVLQGFVVPEWTASGDVADANLVVNLPRTIAELNTRMAALCRELPDAAFYDVERVAGRFGRDAWQDRRLFFTSRVPVSAEAYEAYGQGLLRIAFALFRAPRKVLCTDLDNTLWGGVLGEEGPGGIATGGGYPGNCYAAYQRYLKQLSARGVLLAAVSKNNPADVEEAFRLRAADLALTLDDFVVRKIGWSDKVGSLREIAGELSLGLDSLVFVDDHPVECAAMRQRLPQVATVQVDMEEPWHSVELLSSGGYFDTLAVTTADVQRTDEYRAQARRNELKNSAASREEFLRSLEIVCTFLPVQEAPLARAVQLLGKTNQFNLTTRRHGAVEVEHFAQKGLALAVRVRDRFGDAGVIAVVLVDIRDAGTTWCIDTFLMSCRVIGRGIESTILAEIVTRAKGAGVQRLLGEYQPSSKNSMCANFYVQHGFSVDTTAAGTEDLTSQLFVLDPQSSAVNVPSWVRIHRDGMESGAATVRS